MLIIASGNGSFRADSRFAPSQWETALQQHCLSLAGCKPRISPVVARPASSSQIARFMGPTWGPPGSCQPQMGPILAPWTLLSWVALLSYNNSSSRYPMDRDGFFYKCALNCVGVYEVITGICNRLSVWLFFCQTKWCKITDDNFKCNLSMKIGWLL